MTDRKSIIEELYEFPTSELDGEAKAVVHDTIAQLDRGELRVAEPTAYGWKVNEWVKKAVLLYFRTAEMETIELSPYEWHDKIPLKVGFAELGARVVPPAVARFGSFLSRGVVMMPSYVNIGAWVGENTLVDTWATVGSCAQVGANVHISGGVGIGGVLEPLQAAPVIVEDGAFLGSRCVLVEGVHIGAEAVLGANVVLTASTAIIDVTGEAPVELRSYVPPRSVVIPGTRTKSFPAGDYQLPAALIIGQRRASTDLKTSLNDVLREHALAL